MAVSFGRLSFVLALVGAASLLGCPSSRSEVDDAVASAFKCKPEDGQEGQCPAGAVCGLEGACHPRESGRWKCDASANAADGTNAYCFGTPADVCGADGRCHSTTEDPQDWACTEDAQCLNGRRCSESSWTCVETSGEALLPASTPATGQVEVLPSLFGGRGDALLVAASASSATCSGSTSDGALILRKPDETCKTGAVANRIQAFAWEDGGVLRSHVLGALPLGGEARRWLDGSGHHAFADHPLLAPIARGLLAVELRPGDPTSVVSTETPIGGVFPMQVWIDTDGYVNSRATPTFAPVLGTRRYLEVPPEGASLKLYSDVVGNEGRLVDAWYTTASRAARYRWSGLHGEVSQPPVPLSATLQTGPLIASTPLPDWSGVYAVAQNGVFFRRANGAWEPNGTMAELVSLLNPEDVARVGEVVGGPHALQFHASSDARQVVMTLRASEPAVEPAFIVLPSIGLTNCGMGGASPHTVCFRAACEPCATRSGERAIDGSWIGDADGSAQRFVVRCGSSSGIRTVEVSAPFDVEKSRQRCQVDPRTDELGRSSHLFNSVTRSNAVAYSDAHGLVAGIPRGNGTAELFASGLDRAPHGLARVNGKLAAFTSERTWQRALTPEGRASGAFVHSPMAGISLLGSVHAPRSFTRSLLLASAYGVPQVVDITEPSEDMFPTAAVFQIPPAATAAQHHAVVVQSDGSFSTTGMDKTFTLYTTVGDSLLGAEVSSMMSASPNGAVAMLTVRLTPQPGSDLRSVAYTAPVSDQGATLFARGFALTANGLFGFEAPSPNRFRSYALPSRDERWVGLFTEGNETAARARLAYRDGVIVSLPSQVPLSPALPTRENARDADALVGVLHHCGHTYGLSERTLFHLTASEGQAVGDWVDVLQNADAGDKPFAGGALLRDGDTLYLFGAWGHARTWTAPVCPGG